MHKSTEKVSQRKQSPCYVVSGETTTVPASANAPIAWDHRQVRLQIMPNPAQIVHGLLLGSSYRRLDCTTEQEVTIQVLDAGAQLVVGETFTDVKRFGLAVADGSGGHFGDDQQDRHIAEVARQCSQLALEQLNNYHDPAKCYAALPAIVKTLATTLKAQKLTESCSFSVMLAYVSTDDITVVGLGIGDCLLASLQLQSGRIETICPAHESAHGAAMFPHGYQDVEMRYFQQRLPKGSVLLGFTDGLWAGLPHRKESKTYANGLSYSEISLDSDILAPLLSPQHTHKLGAVAYDILIEHAFQNLDVQRAKNKQNWLDAQQTKTTSALSLLHSGDDSLGQMLQLESLDAYCLETLINFLPNDVKDLAQLALQSPDYSTQESLLTLIQKAPQGSFVWAYALCLLSQGLMQRANRDRYFETYVVALKFATAALKGAASLTGQLLAKSQLQKLLHAYAIKELKSQINIASLSPVDIGLGPYQLQQHRQLLQQRLLQKSPINDTVQYHQMFLCSFVIDQWQQVLQNSTVSLNEEEIALLALGSMGRGEPAPYSDFEFAWLTIKMLPIEKQRLLKRLTEWWYLHIIALGETKTYLSHNDRDPFVKAGFTFDVDVGGLSPLMNDSLINTTEGLARIQEDNSDSNLILRNALISCCYVWGSKKLYEEYQALLAQQLNATTERTVPKSLLGKKLKRSQTYALALMEAALSEFAPSSLNTLKERQQKMGFNVKTELYRLGSQTLTGLCWYYQHYEPGGLQQLRWLHSHKKLQNEAQGHIQQVFEEALRWRYRAQLFYGYENEALYPANVLTESSGREPRYRLTATELKEIQELYRILLPLEQVVQQFLRDKYEGKKSIAFKVKGLYSTDEVTLAIAQARMGNYHEAEKYYQVMTLNTYDPHLYVLRLQNLGQRYEQLQATIREQKYVAGLTAIHSKISANENIEKSPVKSPSRLSFQLEEQAQELKEKAHAIIAQLLTKIVLAQKQVPQQLETLYRQLPFIFRENFRVALLKINEQQPNFSATLQTTLTVLHRYPEISSERIRWQEQKQKWRAALHQCIDEQRPANYQGKPITLHSTLFGQKPLAAIVGDQLLADGEFKNLHIGGSSHRVIKLKLTDEQVLYAKAYPEMPGMTYLIEQLHLRLLGHGVCLSELVKIEIPKKGPVPVLLSHEVKGPTFNAVLRGEPQALKMIDAATTKEALERLDRHLVMGLMLLAMITNPEDGIPTNYIYHLTSDNKATLVSIDHDHALFPAYLDDELQVKTILFCLPLLKETLPSTLKQAILALEVGNELRAVLRDAQAQNKAYLELFSDETMKVWHQQRKGGTTTIPIPIKKGDATKLYFKLIKLQALIKDKPELTGLACLQALEPRVGAVYAKALQEDKTPQQRLQEIGRYTADKQGALISNTQALKSLQLTSTMLSQPAYAKLQDLSPEEGLTELDIIAYQSELIVEVQHEVYQGNLTRFQQVLHPMHQAQVISGEPRKRLKPLQWERLTKDQQRLILDVGKQLTFEHLDLTKCTALTEARLQLLLSQSPDLVSLTLSEFDGFSHKSLNLITKACPSLERLVLRDLTNITGEGSKLPPIFPSLKELQLHRCQKLKSSPIRCPHVSTVIVSECSGLSTQQLAEDLKSTPSLQNIHIDHCSSIEQRQLGNLLLKERGASPALASLLIKDGVLDLTGLTPSVDELMLLMRHHSTLKAIHYPNIDASVIYAIALNILDKKSPPIPFILGRRDYVQISSDVKVLGKYQDLSQIVKWHELQSIARATDIELDEHRIIIKILSSTKSASESLEMLENVKNCLELLFSSDSLTGIIRKEYNDLTWSLLADSVYVRLACLLLRLQPRSITGPLPRHISHDELEYWLQRYPLTQTQLLMQDYHNLTRADILLMVAHSLSLKEIFLSSSSSQDLMLHDIKSIRLADLATLPMPFTWVTDDQKVLLHYRVAGKRMTAAALEAAFQAITDLLCVVASVKPTTITKNLVLGTITIYCPSEDSFQQTETVFEAIQIRLQAIMTLNNKEASVPTKVIGADLKRRLTTLELLAHEPTLDYLYFPPMEQQLTSIDTDKYSTRPTRPVLLALPDGRLVIGSKRGIKIYNLTSYKLEDDHNLTCSSLAIRPDGQVVSGDDDGNTTMKLWDFRFSGEDAYPRIFYIGETKILALAALSDGTIVSGLKDNSIVLWDLRKDINYRLRTLPIKHEASVVTLAVLPDDRLVSGSMDHTIKVWDLRLPDSQVCSKTLRGHTGTIEALTVLPNGRVVSGSADHTLKVWDLALSEDRACVLTLNGHQDSVTALAVMPDGIVISGSLDTTLRIWDLTKQEKKEIIVRGHTEGITSIAVLRKGMIASASLDGSVRVTNLLSWNPISKIRLSNLTKIPLPFNWIRNDISNILEYRSTTEHVDKESLQTIIDLLHRIISDFYPIIESDSACGTVTVQCHEKAGLDIAESVFKAIQLRLQSLVTLQAKKLPKIDTLFSPEKSIFAAEPRSLQPASMLEQLPSEILIHILSITGNPIIFGRLQRVSKALERRLQGESVRHFWHSLLARDFPTLTIPQNPSDLRQLYIQQTAQRRELNKLKPHQEQLFNFIRWNHLSGIQWQDYSIRRDSKNDFIDVVDHDNVSAIDLAYHYGRQEIIVAIYHLMSRKVFNKEKQDTQGRNQLYWAVLCGMETEVKKLIARSDCDFSPDTNSNLLIMATNIGHKNIIEILINAKANVNITGLSRTTPLQIATQMGRTDIVALLLGAKANPDHAPKTGETPLILAAKEGYADIITLLLAAKANPNLACKTGETPLIFAVEGGHTIIVKLLLSAKADPNHALNDGATPFFIAAQEGHTDIVTLLLDAKVNPNRAVNKGITPLHVAAQYGHTDVVRLLLDAKVDVDRVGENESTPLISAAQEGYTDIVALLLNAGADPDHARNDGATSLIFAVQEGHTDVIKLLLSARANPNKATDNGTTPLHIAAANGRVDAIVLLLAAKADPDDARNDGATPLISAAQWGYTDIVALLLNAGADPDHARNDGATSLIFAVQEGHTGVIKLLLSARADPNKAIENGTTPLHIAAANGRVDAIVLLLAAKADLNSVDNDGATPLFLAAEEGHYKAVELLLTSGAEMLARQDKKNPLMVAKEHKHSAIAALLTLWSVKAATKNLPIRQQIIAILKKSLDESSQSSVLSPTFFYSQPKLMLLAAQLDKHLQQSEADETLFLKNWLQEMKAEIPPDKFDFINKHILPGDHPQQECSSKVKLLPSS